MGYSVIDPRNCFEGPSDSEIVGLPDVLENGQLRHCTHARVLGGGRLPPALAGELVHASSALLVGSLPQLWQNQSQLGQGSERPAGQAVPPRASTRCAQGMGPFTPDEFARRCGCWSMGPGRGRHGADTPQIEVPMAGATTLL
jgi:hypothetical protein